MILAQNIIDRMRQAGLDAEGSDYYRDDIDLIPAINAAQEWLIAVINAALGAKKIGEEVLMDISMTRVFQTSTMSRIFFDPAALGHEVWTIVSVIPLPEVFPSPASITPVIPATISLWRNDLAHVKGEHFCKRLTAEEWEKNIKNPFKPGNEVVDCDEMKIYAYLSYFNYFNNTTYPTGKEIEVRPALNQKLCTVRYVKMPTTIVAATDTIEFPLFFSDLLYSKSLQFVAIKQGDGTNLWSVTTQDINNLLRTIL